MTILFHYLNDDSFGAFDGVAIVVVGNSKRWLGCGYHNSWRLVVNVNETFHENSVHHLKWCWCYMKAENGIQKDKRLEDCIDVVASYYDANIHWTGHLETHH